MNIKDGYYPPNFSIQIQLCSLVEGEEKKKGKKFIIYFICIELIWPITVDFLNLTGIFGLLIYVLLWKSIVDLNLNIFAVLRVTLDFGISDGLVHSNILKLFLEVKWLLWQFMVGHLYLHGNLRMISITYYYNYYLFNIFIIIIFF